MELIDKSEVVAEIKKYISNYKEILNKVDKSSDDWLDSTLMLESKIDVSRHILSFLNTLETKEVDLDLEITLWANAIPEIQLDDIERLAKHFFELGIKAKGE